MPQNNKNSKQLEKLAEFLEKHIEEQEKRETWTEKSLEQFLQLQKALEKVQDLLKQPPSAHTKEEEQRLVKILEDVTLEEKKEEDETEEERKLREETESLADLLKKDNEEIPIQIEEELKPQESLDLSLYDAGGESKYNPNPEKEFSVYDQGAGPKTDDLYHNPEAQYQPNKEPEQMYKPSEPEHMKTEGEAFYEKQKEEELETKYEKPTHGGHS